MARGYVLVVALAVLLSGGCTGSGSSSEPTSASTPGPRTASSARLREPMAGIVVLGGQTGEQLAVAASQSLFEGAPLVVLASPGDPAGQARAASVAVTLGAPLLLTPGADPGGAAPSGAPSADPLTAEIDRLEPDAVLAVGQPAAAWAQRMPQVEVFIVPEDPGELAVVTGADFAAPRAVTAEGLLMAVAELPGEGAPSLLSVDTPAPAVPPTGTGAGELPAVVPPDPLDGVVVLASAATADSAAAAATARAAGADVLVMDQYDPRADSDVVGSLSERQPQSVLALGDAFGDPSRLAGRVFVAANGALLPGGGQLVVPGRRFVALYGHPGAPALGVLGEQDIDAAISRVQEVAASYTAAGSTEPVIPTFEIITTIASASAGSDGDYSSEATPEQLRPWVDAAGKAGVYIVLDLQPGRTDFLTQAKLYEDLLALPHVGLALDPEWRLAPEQVHLRQVGTVGADEVNSVIDWLATFTRERALPQKILLLHQFRTSMLTSRERIDTGRDELAVIVQMDGHGHPESKLATWRAITASPSPGLSFGWKNFYDEDAPNVTPTETLELRPAPVFISYQ